MSYGQSPADQEIDVLRTQGKSGNWQIQKRLQATGGVPDTGGEEK